MEKITWKSLKIIADELNKKIVNSFVNGLSVVNSTDYLLSFSFYKEEKLFISLNHENPFISLVEYKESIPTTLGHSNDFLRKYIKDSLVNHIETINDDRILKISFVRNDEFYQKENIFMYIELFPHRSNLIITDSNDIILFATHYNSLIKGRCIANGLTYNPLEKSAYIEINDKFDLIKFKEDAKKYIEKSLNKKESEKYEKLYKFIKSKIKSLSKKISVLNSEINKSKNYQNDIDTANNLAMFYSDENGLKEYVKNNNLDYDFNLTLSDNIQKIFKKSKKKKRTIEMNQIELEKCLQEIDNFQTILDAWSYLKEEELKELNLHYFPSKKKDNNSIMAIKPSYIIYNETKIGFGKNAKQNDYLSFKLANNSDYFLHIENYSGSHVVIFSSSPSDEELLLASEICLILSNKTSGDISVSQIKDIKKGQYVGQVYKLKYKTITLNKVREKTKELIKNSFRFR